MKKAQVTCFVLATLMLLSSCNTAGQAYGGLVGASIGGRVGGTVGFLAGGSFRGSSSALGSLVGMGVGAVIGVGIASQIEANENNTITERNQNTRIKREENGVMTRVRPGSFNPIAISGPTYMDVTGDGYISKNETIELEAYITNTSDYPLNDVTICINVSDTKHFTLSPPLTTNLQPGQKIRYTGRVHCNKARRGQSIEVCLTTTHAGKTNASESIYINQM